MKAEFGAEVAVLVDGVTKLDGSKWGDHAEGETFRKMILAASIDLRVLVIKLADRVHNLRTLGHHAKREKRERIARASMELLVPFAQRLGLYDYQREMEDLAFATLSPEAHERVAGLVRQTEDGRRAALGELITGMRAELAAAGVRAQVEARARHLYSIHRSLPGGSGWTPRAAAAAARRRRGPVPLRPTDAARVVVVVDGSEGDCYVALGVLHGRWHPVDDRFRDYISMPKYNMYRSLHTAVLVGGEPVGVLIRTPAMDAVATYGVAARIREAGGRDGKVSADLARRADLDWLDRLLAWQPLAAPGEFLDGLRADLSDSGMIVFTAGRHAGEAALRLDRGRLRLRGLPGHRRQRRRRAGQRDAQADGEPPVARPGRRPDHRAVRGPAGLVAGRRAQRPGPGAPEGGHRPPQGRGGRRPRPRRGGEGPVRRSGDGGDGAGSLRDLEDDGTAFSAARRLGFPDLDALYEAVGLDKLSAPGFLTHLGAAAARGLSNRGGDTRPARLREQRRHAARGTGSAAG